MEFIKIWVLNDNEEQALGEQATPVLFNVANIVSIKPIRIMKSGSVIDGYWIRTINNKKYRATDMPQELKKMFEGDSISSNIIEKIDENNGEFISEHQLQ